MSVPPHIGTTEETLPETLGVIFHMLALQQAQIAALANILIEKDPEGYRMKAGGPWDAFDLSRLSAFTAGQGLVEGHLPPPGSSQLPPALPPEPDPS